MNTNPIYSSIYNSPLGPITLQSDGKALTYVSFGVNGVLGDDEHVIFNQTKGELDEYFSGKRKTFSVPVRISGTPFQNLVWKALLQIPYGQTRSYEDIAIQIGNPKACRAIGMANNRNNIGILIPCHRVIGKNGSLVGYAGGLDKKVALLELERMHR